MEKCISFIENQNENMQISSETYIFYKSLSEESYRYALKNINNIVNNKLKIITIIETCIAEVEKNLIYKFPGLIPITERFIRPKLTEEKEIKLNYSEINKINSIISLEKENKIELNSGIVERNEIINSLDKEKENLLEKTKLITENTNLEIPFKNNIMYGYKPDSEKDLFNFTDKQTINSSLPNLIDNNVENIYFNGSNKIPSKFKHEITDLSQKRKELSNKELHERLKLNSTNKENKGDKTTFNNGNPIRRDNFGTPIVKGSKKHKVTHADIISKSGIRFLQVVNIQSFKKDNLLNTFCDKNTRVTCCLVF
jgi:hypothetical protein